MNELAPSTAPGPEPAPLGLLDKLGGLFRTYAIPKESLVLSPPFPQDDRAAYTFLVPPEWPSDADGTSALILLEDGVSLGPAHSNHDDIRTLGRGRYSHWGPKVYFSTSDNSDPASNGRTYSVIPPEGQPAGLPGPDGLPVAARRPTPRGALPHDKVSVEWSVTDVDPSALLPVDGHAFAIPVPRAWPSDQESLSTLMLLEDGRPLPYPHSQHADIALTGRGRYSHWSDELRFSSTDNSDPRTNGRRYSVARSDAFLFKHAPVPPRPEQGACYILDGLPAEWVAESDGSSRLVLLEDGAPLGPGGASHDSIRSEGAGRYSHWGRQLWFSTSDNSDPRRNGRTYTVVWQPLDDDDA